MKILFVSIAFPPKADPECIQTGRYYKAIKNKTEFDIQVLTSKSPTLFMDIDDSLKRYLSSQDNIIEIPIYETKESNFLIRKLIPGGTEWPDSKFTFHMQWKNAVRKIRKPDIIYSRSFPLSSTIMAYRIAMHHDVPWVLHLSDPWSISPIHSRSRINQKLQDKWEKKCFDRANTICFTSEATVAAYSQLYPDLKHKFEVIPNVPYDYINPINHQCGPKLKIAYTGGFAGLRSPEFFLKALEKLVFDQPEIEDKMEVICAGNMDRVSSAMFTATKLKCVKHLGAVSLYKSIELQQNSDVLLSIDNPIAEAEQAMFIPSKIYDYLNSKRRILALTTKNSSTSKFLQNFKADVVQYNNVEEIQHRLKEYLLKLNMNDDLYFQQENGLPIEVQLSYNVEKLSKLLNNAISGNG